MPDNVLPDAAPIYVSDRAQARIRNLRGERAASRPSSVRLFAERRSSGRLEAALGFDEPQPSGPLLGLEGSTLLLDDETRCLWGDVGGLHLDDRDGSRRGFAVPSAPEDERRGVAKPKILPNSSC